VGAHKDSHHSTVLLCQDQLDTMLNLPYQWNCLKIQGADLQDFKYAAAENFPPLRLHSFLHNALNYYLWYLSVHHNN
jgi:hypothetical protein